MSKWGYQRWRKWFPGWRVKKVEERIHMAVVETFSLEFLRSKFWTLLIENKKNWNKQGNGMAEFKIHKCLWSIYT